MGRNKHRQRHDRPNSWPNSSPPAAATAAHNEHSPACDPAPVAVAEIDSPAPPAEETDADSATIDGAVNDASADVSAALFEKDELIAALTAQLEETVEQLDRLHRQGADRASPRSAGSSSGLNGDSLATSDRINQWLDQWDATQPIDLWTRIEQRIEEIAGQLGSGSHPRESHAAEAPSHSPPSTTESSHGIASSWEETKRRLLGEVSDAAPAESPAAPPVQDAPIEPPVSQQVEYPAAIDVDSADRHQLIEGIEIRDRYISYLTHRLRAAEMRQPVDWDALNQAPADLRQQLEDLENRYREHLRREECDMALERARLAREQARLQQDRHRLEQQIRRAGVNPDEYKTPVAPGRGDDDRSWLNVFGRKK